MPQLGHGYRGLIDLIHQSHESDRSKARLRRKSKVIFRALSEAKILEIKTNETRAGRTVSIAAELQDDFSIHHSLSLFLIHAVDGSTQAMTLFT